MQPTKTLCRSKALSIHILCRTVVGGTINCAGAEVVQLLPMCVYLPANVFKCSIFYKKMVFLILYFVLPLYSPFSLYFFLNMCIFVLYLFLSQRILFSYLDNACWLIAIQIFNSIFWNPENEKCETQWITRQVIRITIIS